jgi:iron complex outermembrane receptor protein
VQWIGGLFYFTEDVWQTVGNRIYSPATGAIVTGPETTYRGTTESYAAYGQVDWPFATHWTLTLGGRYTREDKSIAGTIGTAPFANTTDYSSFNPKLGVSFAAADNVFLYASVSTGFRAGGFNGFGGTIPAVSTPFGAEKVRAYEVGAKTTWLDRRARLNAAVYRNDYRDLQSNAPNANGTFVTQNALDVRDSGVELEFTGRLTDALELTIAAGYQHQDFLMIRPGTVFATSGARHTTNVAPYSGAVGMNYRVPAGVRGADFRAAANLVLRGTSYASNDNNAVSENSNRLRVRGRRLVHHIVGPESDKPGGLVKRHRPSGIPRHGNSSGDGAAHLVSGVWIPLWQLKPIFRWKSQPPTSRHTAATAQPACAAYSIPHCSPNCAASQSDC